MDCVGIVAEFNPFHNGHKYLLEKAKALSGCRFALTVMSGNFVQRGDVALFDKYARAKCALKSGADIVIELPVSFAVANAERFSKAAIHLMHACGIVSALAFGAESDDVDILSLSADKISALDIQTNFEFQSALKKGMSYPRALSEALDIAAPLTPNNILAIEYLRALKSFNSPIKPYAIERLGAQHDSSESNGLFQSASYIREAMRKNGVLACGDYIPYAHELDAVDMHFLDQISDAIIYSLRMKSIDRLKALPDVSEGFENVIYRACRAYSNVSDLISGIKTKRFTMARIRRIMLYSLLEIDKEILRAYPLPSYIRIIGIKREALSILSELSKRASLPVIKDYSDTRQLSLEARSQLELELRADSIYNLASNHSGPVVNDFSSPLLIV